MNKFKFFGSAMMAAFFAFSLASCEKEDLHTDVDINVPDYEVPDAPEGYKPGDAVLTIQPTVIAVIDGDIKNVTDEAKITYNGNDKLEYSLTPDKGIAAMEIEIVASYDVELNGETQTLTVSSTLNTPALSAGQVAIYTPTLLVSANSEPEDEGGEGGEGEGGEGEGGEGEGGEGEGGEGEGGEGEGGEGEGGEGEGGEGEGGDPTPGPGTADPSIIYNVSESSVTSSVETKHFHYKNENSLCVIKSLGAFANNSISGHQSFVGLSDVQALINAYDGIKKDFNFGTYHIYPNSITCIEAEVTTERKEYIVSKSVRSSSEVGKIITKEVISVVYSKITYGLALENTGHSHSHGTTSHGHGHGHGGGNAGGGISIGI